MTTGFSKSKVENPRKACERFAKGLRKVTVPCSGCSPSICIFYLPRENENLLEGGNTDLLLCICRGIRMLFPTCEVRVVGFISELFSEGGSSPPSSSFPSCKCLIAVRATGPQPQVPDRSGHYRSSTQNRQSHNIEMSWWGSFEVKLYVWFPTSLAKGPAKGLSKQYQIVYARER